MTNPILYSYRRCPYAMRGRMALKVAGVDVEIREISLREKPKHMLQVSPKGTVPVLVPPSGAVVEESLDIMHWALAQSDPEAWLAVDADALNALITENDTKFKHNLDRYKYPERFPERDKLDYRAEGELFLQQLETLLNTQQYLFRETPSMADIAIFPFVRQFANVDRAWFDQAPYPKLIKWLEHWLASELFESIMQKHPTYLD